MSEAKIEYIPKEEWSQWHTELLQSTLNRLYQRVPFYREKFEVLGILPEDLKSPNDLVRFPLTTREDLSAHYPYDLFAVPLRDIVRLHSLPWLPNPIVKGFTIQDVENLKKLNLRFLSTCGLGREDILLITLEPGMGVWIEEIKEAAEAIGATVIPPAPRSPELSLRILKDFRATVWVSTPSLVAHFMKVAEGKGLSPPESLRLIILVGEELKSSDRTRIEEFFGAETRLGYGIAEVLGPGMAYECEARNGLHLAADYLYPEVLAPETGEPAEEGELILTTLKVRANPLLRFRTGDKVRLTWEPCACGRTTPRLLAIEAQTRDRLSYRGVKIHLRVLEDLMLKVFGLKPRYRLKITGKEPATELRLEIVMEEKLFLPSIVELHEEAHGFERAFWEFFGIPCRVKWVES